jgi:hypothetical protein
MISLQEHSLRASFFLVVIRNCLEVSYRLLGTAYRRPLKMGLIGRPETSVSNYRTMPRKTPEERITRLHRDGSLKSRSNSAHFNILSSNST